jgi:superfamily II RNA helicase
MRFREYESGGGGEFELDPFQVEAIEAIEAGRSVLVAAPTGAGKTVVAEYAVEEAIQAGRRVIYTAPIKALSNQKFRDFRSRFGDNVGIMTGDVTINGDALALIMTTEIFRNALFEESGRFDDAKYLIFDEVHYINDLERGTVWEESIIFAPKAMQLVCLSATMPNVQELADWIAEVRETEVDVIRETHRPVPLRYFINVGKRLVKLKELPRAMQSRRPKRRNFKDRKSRKSRRERSDAATDHIVDRLVEADRLPCIFFCFSRAACEAKASHSAWRDLLGDDERERVMALYRDLAERYDCAGDRRVKEFARLIRNGIAYHHAGMLPTLKDIIERLFSSGGVKLLFTTETFAVGVNMPARTVAFDSLRKFDGVTFDYMQSREYHQMAGRAGRRGMDKVGYVYAAVDPEEDDARGVRRVLTGRIERIESRFELSYSAILSLYERVGEAIYDACSSSFASFQRRHHHRPKTPPQTEKRLAKKKLKVLRQLRYLDNEGLTGKGRIAEMINGYDLPVAEMYADGVLENLDPDRLNVLMVGIVHEPRRRSRPVRLKKRVLSPIADGAMRCTRRIHHAERAAKLEFLTKPPAFGLSLATWQWSRGCSFDEMERYTDLAAGDVCRNFRLAIQLMRQTIRATRGDDSLRDRLREAMDRLNRDVVDAERQLRVE